MKIQKFLGLAILVMFAACSSSSSSSGGNDGTDGTITGVRIKGKLASLTASTINPMNKAVTKSATDVVVTNPVTGAAKCKTATIDSTGAFEVDIKDDEPALITIIDSAQVGEDMKIATVKIEDQGLNTIPPNNVEGTEVDLQTLTISDEVASSSVDGATLIAELGNTEALATEIASQDEIAMRFSNPDLDSNGEVDCVESTAEPDSQGNKSNDFMLDFHIRFNMKLNGTAVKISDMIGNYLSSADTTASYDQTGIYVAYLNTFSSESRGTVTFEQRVTTSEVGVVAVGTPVPSASVTTNAFGSYNGYGVNITNASELPYGKIIFQMGSETLTFTDVEVPTLAELNAPVGRVLPFIKLTMNNPACTTSCTLASLSYKWMKKTSNSWEAATLGDVTLLVKSDGGVFSFRVDGNTNKYVTITIPKPTSDSNLEGTITWTASNVSSHEGVTDAEFDGLYTSQLCHIGLSYDDQLGMRYFETIENASGTCAGDVS